ncbi:MAG TPA: hypothetical protein PLP21_14250 [Pyrinomonadaceae bacterium]|nr:hypothetical protein [Pyrinomonadaceae bacterium]
MSSANPVHMLIGAVIGTSLIFGLTWLMLFLNKRGFKTHPSEKRLSQYKRLGQAKAEKRRRNRRYRF